MIRDVMVDNKLSNKDYYKKLDIEVNNRNNYYKVKSFYHAGRILKNKEYLWEGAYTNNENHYVNSIS